MDRARGRGGAGPAQGSPALHLLLQLLHLVANLPGHWARLPHLGEQGCHLVTAQEAGSAAPQLMQEASLHRTWATEGTATSLGKTARGRTPPPSYLWGAQRRGLPRARTGGCGSGLGRPGRYIPTSSQSAPTHAPAPARPGWTPGGFDMPFHPRPLPPLGLVCHASCMWHRPEAWRTKLPGRVVWVTPPLPTRASADSTPRTGDGSTQPGSPPGEHR